MIDSSVWLPNIALNHNSDSTNFWSKWAWNVISEVKKFKGGGGLDSDASMKNQYIIPLPPLPNEKSCMKPWLVLLNLSLWLKHWDLSDNVTVHYISLIKAS